jgi:hypothetical protein
LTLSEIAKKTTIPYKNINRNITKLLRIGLISVEKVNGVKSSSYCINYESSKLKKEIVEIEDYINIVKKDKKKLPALATTEPTTAITATEPTTAITATEPTTAITATEPTTAITATEPTTAITTTEPTTAITATEPTTAITTTEPTTAITATEPTTAITTTEPTTAITATEPTTAEKFNNLFGVNLPENSDMTAAVEMITRREKGKLENLKNPLSYLASIAGKIPTSAKYETKSVNIENILLRNQAVEDFYKLSMDSREKLIQNVKDNMAGNKSKFRVPFELLARNAFVKNQIESRS